MFNKPLSVYIMVILLGTCVGTALYASKTRTRNLVLIERVDYYKTQISTFEASLSANRLKCQQTEELMQKTKESTEKLDQKGKELTKQIEEIKPQLQEQRKSDEPIKTNDGPSDDVLYNSMWRAYCNSKQNDSRCTK